MLRSTLRFILRSTLFLWFVLCCLKGLSNREKLEIPAKFRSNVELAKHEKVRFNFTFKESLGEGGLRGWI